MRNVKASAYSAVYNGNCTEWSAIWTEIKRVITKSHDREAGGNDPDGRLVWASTFKRFYYRLAFLYLSL